MKLKTLNTRYEEHTETIANAAPTAAAVLNAYAGGVKSMVTIP